MLNVENALVMRAASCVHQEKTGFKIGDLA